MLERQVTIDVAASAEHTFDVFSDLDRLADRVSAIQSLERLNDAPLGLGAQWRETRVMFGQEASADMTMSAFERPHRYASTSSGAGFEYRSSLSFEPEGERTRVIWTFLAAPTTQEAEAMVDAMSDMLDHSVEAMRTDLNELKQAAESEAG